MKISIVFVVLLYLRGMAQGQEGFEDNLKDPYVPPATVELIGPPTRTRYLQSDPATLSPATLTATLASGESVDETKTLTLPIGVSPPKADIMFALDLTGSMGGEISNAKANSVNIMTQLDSLIDDTQFGVQSFMDYAGGFTSCGAFASTYGDSRGGDYPYQLDQALTSDTGLVSSAMNSLTLGWGADWAESYSRVLYESYADGNIGWRSGAKKIVIMWGDAVPHDCNYVACLGGHAVSGVDPGRDSIADTEDDLAILDVLDSMAANEITLIFLYSGGDASLWDCYARRTGGRAYGINYDGTIPGGTNVADYITGLVEAEISTIDNLALEVCADTSAYTSWLTSVEPPFIMDIELETEVVETFDISITVPSGTTDGSYELSICATGDGVEYARQTVQIEVVNNQPPVAICQDITLAVDDSCATGSITPEQVDGGSTDPDGDELTLTLSSAGPFSSPGEYSVTLTVDDGSLQDTCTSIVTVIDNILPEITCAESYAVPVNTAIGDVVLSSSDNCAVSSVAQSIGAEESFTEATVLTVDATVTDESGNSASCSVLIAVYDPNAGFVTGGGWIWSPTGAFVADSALEGKANFGFNAKYKKGATTPSGETEFMFGDGNLNFHSDSYEWLVVTEEPCAKLKGMGSLNGETDYGFMITVCDVGEPGSDDTFRIKIWDSAEAVVFDNKISAGDDEYVGTVLDGGNIQIHNGGNGGKLRG